MLVSLSDHFNWFGHTYSHTKTHGLSLSELYTSMKLNKQFAKVPNTNNTCKNDT